MQKITIIAGKNKKNELEDFEEITLCRGEICSIVGNTGSGKSRLIKDIEQLATGDSITGRTVLVDGNKIEKTRKRDISSSLIAHLSQNMRFVLDTTIEEFLLLHGKARNKKVPVQAVIDLANTITPEPISPQQSLNLLSGGQSRALMVADIALICDSEIVLVDEIENAGIDKERALNALVGEDKLVLVVTHDPHTALMASKRIVMKGGGVKAVIEKTADEEKLFEKLRINYYANQSYQKMLREGAILK